MGVCSPGHVVFAEKVVAVNSLDGHWVIPSFVDMHILQARGRGDLERALPVNSHFSFLVVLGSVFLLGIEKHNLETSIQNIEKVPC